MKRDVDATLNQRGYQEATSLLLRHCLSLGTAEGRIPARLRLEAAIGELCAVRQPVQAARAAQ